MEGRDGRQGRAGEPEPVPRCGQTGHDAACLDAERGTARRAGRRIAGRQASRECRNNRLALDAALLRQGFRGADFILNHLAVGDQLAERWSKVE